MKIIWLSHILSEKTPLYGGASDISIISDKSLNDGDSCNTSKLTLSGHSGSHVDVPYHFISQGKKLDEYLAENWVFYNPLVIDINVVQGQMIGNNDLSLLNLNKKNIDLVLIKSNFEVFRGRDIYWQESPGLVPEMAEFLKSKFPSIRAVGMDFISISSLKHRDIGRLAHKAFLKQNILLFEDLSLINIKQTSKLKKVVALPLIYAGGDGAPCTVIGWIDEI